MEKPEYYNSHWSPEAKVGLKNVMRIKDSIKGNGLAASRDFKAGDVLIEIPEPFLLLVENEELNNLCSYCFSGPGDTGPLKKCGGCRRVCYCTPACQKADWKTIHKQECGILKKINNDLPTTVRGVVQTMLRHQYGKALDPIWADLQSHEDDFTDNMRADMNLQATAAVVYSKGDRSGLIGVGLQIVMRLATCAFRAISYDDSPTGLCFSPTLALVNHSCSPNAFVGFNGRCVSLRALRPIRKGEEMFISYVDYTQPREKRRAELEERYFFKCDCEVCEQNLDPYSLTLKYQPQAGPENAGLFELWWEEDKLLAEAKTCAAKITPEMLSLYLADEPDRFWPQTNRKIPDGFLMMFRKKAGHFSKFIDKKLFALPPLPLTIHDIFHSNLLDTEFAYALIPLLFLSTRCDPFTYPQPHHPVRVVRLYTITVLLKELAMNNKETLLDHDPPFDEQQQYDIRHVDYFTIVQALLYILRELVPRSHGKDSRFMKLIVEDVELVETVQFKRPNPHIGREVQCWGNQIGGAAEGRERVKELFTQVRNLAKLTGALAPGVEA